MAEGVRSKYGSRADPNPEPVPTQIPIPSTDTQKLRIGLLLKTPLRKGDLWFLVDCRWFKQWKKYVGFDSWDMYNVGETSHYPGPIDNSGLFLDHETTTLKENLIDELHYVLMSNKAWHKLVGWYGCLEGQQPIVRKVVEDGMFVKHCKVEVYLLELILCENNNIEDVVMRRFSKADTIDTIEKEMKSLFNIPTKMETRLWNMYMSNTYEELKLDGTVQDAGLFQGQLVVIEQKNEDGSWPRQAKYPKSNMATSLNISTSPKLSSNSSATISSTLTSRNNNIKTSNTLKNSTSDSRLGGNNSYRVSSNKSQFQPGLCGLSNLGNTCFMNSALQCLSNTSPLTEYFLNDQYATEINRKNPLGMRGAIAETYANLLKQMWLSQSSFVAPRTFKTQLGRFAPQFSGYHQQDSQELLAFLLDGLHEDLNRVKEKPYLTLRDSEGRPDEVVAKEAWTIHRLRNNSIIVDIFHGLFKSTLVCPECSNVSVTFDPFCYLTLPLPLKKDRNMEVILVRTDPQARAMQYRVVVPKLGTVGDMCRSLSSMSGVPAENMAVAEVYSHHFHKMYRWEDGLSNILEKDNIFVYEVEEENAENIDLPVYFRERHMKHMGGSKGTILFGLPLIITVPRQNLTVDLLYEKVLVRIGRYVKQPQDSSSEGKTLASSSSSSSRKATAINYNADLELCGNPSSERLCCSSECTNETGQNQGQPSGTCIGPNGIYEGEEEAMDHQVSPEPENSQSEDLVGEEDDFQGLESDPIGSSSKFIGKSSSTHRKLFTFNMVNSYGTANISPLTCDGNVLKLNTHSTVAVDWDREIKRLCFDDLEAEAFEKHESIMHQQKKKSTVALRECIKLFTTMETLGEHNPWYCSTCKKHQQATKKFDLWSLPHILVVHLKRFSYNRSWRNKLDTVVDFPVRDLNMSEFVCDPRVGPHVYDLIAVSNHSGVMGGGHYTAYGKNKSDEKWHYFDDSSVFPATEDQIVTKAAYVLFYQRRDMDGHTGWPPSTLLGKTSETRDDHMDTN